MKKQVKKEEIKEEKVTITPPNFKDGELWIRGTAPLVIHKFSAKARKIIKDKQQAGSTATKNRRKEAKNFEECFHEARHISMEGWDGIPAGAFRNALVDACKLVGFASTAAKKALFIYQDGFDRDEGTPLVRIIGEEPRLLESMVRVGSGLNKTVDIAVRPQWLDWGARLRFQFDADLFTLEDVVNLVSRAGVQIGICEGRPFSKNSAGMGWGTFCVVTDPNEKAALAAKFNGGAK